MSYTIKDHGFWELYKPDQLPRGYAPGAMFARRDGDGQDWYAYVYQEPSFDRANVVATAKPEGDRLRVQAIVRDPSMLFPAGTRVIEISGVDPADEKPHKLFEQQFVDVEAGTFTRDEPA